MLDQSVAAAGVAAEGDVAVGADDHHAGVACPQLIHDRPIRVEPDAVETLAGGGGRRGRQDQVVAEQVGEFLGDAASDVGECGQNWGIGGVGQQ